VRRSDAGLTATIASDYGGIHKEQVYDHIVVNHGTVPNDELYFGLKPGSRNLGAVDQERLLAGLPQESAEVTVANPAGNYSLYRIGDAVSSRNVHAAIYDALRLVKDL
jgi:hypothetical protein